VPLSTDAVPIKRSAWWPFHGGIAVPWNSPRNLASHLLTAHSLFLDTSAEHELLDATCIYCQRDVPQEVQNQRESPGVCTGLSQEQTNSSHSPEDRGLSTGGMRRALTKQNLGRPGVGNDQTSYLQRTASLDRLCASLIAPHGVNLLGIYHKDHRVQTMNNTLPKEGDGPGTLQGPMTITKSRECAGLSASASDWRKHDSPQVRLCMQLRSVIDTSL
jgi:hypothetical protein